MSTTKASWLEFNRSNDGTPYVTAYDGADPLYTHKVTNTKDLQEWIGKIGCGNVNILVAETLVKNIPAIPDFGSVHTPILKRVLLDPGHSEKRTGCRGKNPAIHEEALNRFQAEVLKEELAALGVAADIIDTEEDDLTAIGLASKGYDGFFSLHLNAYDGREHYTCFMVHNTQGSPLSNQLAKEADTIVSSAMQNKPYGGPYSAGLSVLRAAEGVCHGPCVLSELEFLDDETEEGPIKERLKAGLKAYASVIVKYL